MLCHKNIEATVAEGVSVLRMSGQELLQWAVQQDHLLSLRDGDGSEFVAIDILLAYGLSLRKKGLFRIADSAWKFAQESCLGHHYGVSSIALPFWALQVSRCLHYDNVPGVLEQTYKDEIFYLINDTYSSMRVPCFQTPLDLFYFYRAQYINFPGTYERGHVVHVDIRNQRVLDWAAPCPCQSDIPYGECCGLHS